MSDQFSGDITSIFANAVSSAEGFLAGNPNVSTGNGLPNYVVKGAFVGISNGRTIFEFMGTEIPESFQLGGVQTYAVHQFPHGQTEQLYRTVDTFGDQPHPIQFSGEIFTITAGTTVSDPSGITVGTFKQNKLAIERMKDLDALRTSGTPIKFIFDTYEAHVIVTEFTPTVHHVNLVSYSITMEVLSDNLLTNKFGNTQVSTGQYTTTSRTRTEVFQRITHAVSSINNLWTQWSPIALTTVQTLGTVISTIRTNPSNALGLLYLSPTLGEAFNVLSSMQSAASSIASMYNLVSVGSPAVPPAQVTAYLAQIKKAAELAPPGPPVLTSAAASLLATEQSDVQSAATVTSILGTLQAALDQFMRAFMPNFILTFAVAQPLDTLPSSYVTGVLLAMCDNGITSLRAILSTFDYMTPGSIGQDQTPIASLHVYGEGILNSLVVIQKNLQSIYAPFVMPVITVSNPDLYKIASSYYGNPEDWSSIAKANGFQTPYPAKELNTTNPITIYLPPESSTGQILSATPSTTTVTGS